MDGLVILGEPKYGNLHVDSDILKTTLTLLFALKSWQKRLILLGFDSIFIMVSVLLALAARLESHDFLYQIESYIACAVAFTCCMALFFVRGFYNAFTRHITIDTALTIIAAAVTSALVMLALITLAAYKSPGRYRLFRRPFRLLASPACAFSFAL